MPQHLENDRKPYHHGDLRNALIQAGRELLEVRGREGFDLRNVARSAGVSHAAPYRHFTDKQALISAIVEQGFRELSADIEKSLSPIVEKMPARLLAAATAYVKFAFRNPWLMREMFTGRASEIENPTLFQAEKAVFRIYSTIIRFGQDAGEISKEDPNALAGVFWSHIHGIAMLVIDGQVNPYAQGEEGVGRMVEFGVRTLYTGLRGRS